jgi:hypothetical protein
MQGIRHVFTIIRLHDGLAKTCRRSGFRILLYLTSGLAESLHGLQTFFPGRSPGQAGFEFFLLSNTDHARLTAELVD